MKLKWKKKKEIKKNTFKKIITLKIKKEQKLFK
jgi:hypothetical protein